MRLFLCSLAVFIAFLQSMATEIRLASFGNNDALRKWHIRKNTTATISKWPDNFPGTCVKLTMDRYREGNERWPAIVLQAPELPSDWSGGRELQFDVYAETAGTLSLSLHSGDQRNQPSVTLPRGRSRVSIPLPKGALDYGNMSELHFFIGDPEKDFVWYIGDVVLTRPDAAERYAELLPRWQKLQQAHAAPETELAEADRMRAQIKEKIRTDNHSTAALKMVEEWSTVLSDLEFQIQERALSALARPDGLIALWASSLEKVHRDRQRFLNFPSPCGRITAAANEAEAIQLILRSPHGLPAVSAAFTGSARSADRTEIPSKQLQIMPVGYVFCDQPLYAVPRTGYWPDPLLNYTDRVDLEKNLWQAFWVEANIPAGQAPGKYTATVAVRSGSTELFRLPLEITVHNFELPSGTPYSNVFSISASYEDDPRAAKDPERYRQAIRRELMRHRLNPVSLYDWRTPSVEDAREQLANGLKNFNVRYGIYGDERNLNDYIAQVGNAYRVYREAGIADHAYCYVFDEAPPSQIPEIAAKLAAVRAQIPDVKFLTTAYDYSFGVDSPLHEIDMWCPLTPQYEKHPEAIKRAREHGKEVWWYVCCNPLAPYANLFIEFPSLGMRLLTGAQAWKYRPDGLLYYAATFWGERGNRHEYLFERPPMTGAPLTNWNGRTFDKFNGDGLLLYPGENGPVPTLRLKQLRDGLEDYFYWQLLSQALANSGFMAETWKERARRELEIRPELVHSLTDFAGDPQLLLAQRDRLATLLNEYQAAKPKQ